MSRRPSRGFVLPFVLLVLAATSMLVFALVNEGWHSARAVRLAVDGEDALAAAEEAQAMALSQWHVDSLWARGLSTVTSRRLVSATGRAVDVHWQRTHPLVALLRTTYAGQGRVPHSTVRRELLRTVWLSAPELPLLAALTVNGVVTGRDGTLISGTDVATPTSACGLVRDTASVSAIVARGVAEDSLNSWPGRPTASAMIPELSDSLQAAFTDVRQRAPHVVQGRTPQPLPVRNGWQPLVMTGDTVVVEGPTYWQGLLLIEGAVVLRGTITIDGVLLVRGPLDARAAQLRVQGAVVVADDVTHGAQLGDRTHLFYDRCAVQMALATVARPSLGPFSLWHPLSP